MMRYALGYENRSDEKSHKLPIKNARDSFGYLVQKILLSKGGSITPRLVSQSCAGQTTVREVVTVMEKLSEDGVGQYFNVYQEFGIEKHRKMFIKKPLNEIEKHLHQYNISTFEYAQKFNCESSVSEIKGKKIGPIYSGQTELI